MPECVGGPLDGIDAPVFGRSVREFVTPVKQGKGFLPDMSFAFPMSARIDVHVYVLHDDGQYHHEGVR